ncbi:TraR/DksA family transcriptional regulator [Phaeobacter sp. QD34_3]|uniref:TraR/DksA family transcriptional regulator n=1 Tax=unclassified Phaeobacter TaxID=2621772 RepID=UPI00237F84CD|nr:MULTISPECIES: TraR/DksA family transcriptional regulator [unclassified Phaeobacter]MDE4131807.1 TraR/DksA family transcriptional regulator [Phaeobacter sp. QD34_3]MDE4135445.1 TraR/DksA family transcriptional regulator [Phaeobacter sp. QD34_24]MDE4173434.1 TraR/DksA family transcriptional regulator [Phaeobacter sp. PT47_59]
MTFENRKLALEARRKALSGHLVEVEHALDEPMPKDWEDRSSERQGDEVLESLGKAELDELRQIDAALARLQEGTYGFCQICGDEISSERLDLLPATPFCKACAK